MPASSRDASRVKCRKSRADWGSSGLARGEQLALEEEVVSEERGLQYRLKQGKELPQLGELVYCRRGTERQGQRFRLL